MRRWRSKRVAVTRGQNAFRQVVVPKEYDEELLSLAHEVPMGGHSQDPG